MRHEEGVGYGERAVSTRKWGLTPEGQWVAVRHGFLLPARVVMAVFRGKMVAAIRQTLARGALALPAPMRPQQVLNLLNRLGHPTKTKWNVRIMEPCHQRCCCVVHSCM